MAVTGPWVGSSAKATTGEAWMAQAGAKLRLSTPFWMSNMIGRNVWNARIKITIHRPAVGPRIAGAWTNKGNTPWNVLLDARGELSGIWETGFELGAFGISQPDRTDGYNPGMALRGSGNFNTNWRADIEGGGVFFFNNTGRDLSGWRQYDCTDPQGYYNWLSAREDQVLQISLTQI